MTTSLKTRGRPSGGKNLAFVTVLQLREKLTDAARIPVSIKFAKQMNLIDEGEELPQASAPIQEKQEKPIVSFSVSENF